MLTNTGYCLNKLKKLTVGYFGGSITEGSGASSGSKCYRATVTAWLREKYPEAEITEIRAAVGGTGSDLGMYRCERDLLSHRPDLVFFEFAVNDRHGRYEAVCAQTETVFRKIWQANPYAELVTVFTSTGHVHNTLAAGDEYVSRTAQSAVSHRYGVPSVDVGEILRTRVLLEGGDFLKYTVDLTHPNDDGHRVYADALIARLEGMIPIADAPVPRTLPEPLCPKLYENATMKDISELEELESSGFRTVEESLGGRYPRYFEATEPGAYFTFTFQGEGLGFYWLLARDGGDISVEVDGGEPTVLRSFDSYCLRFNRASGCFAFGDLPLGKHSVKVTVLPDRAEESAGTAIRIGAVLMH